MKFAIGGLNGAYALY